MWFLVRPAIRLKRLVARLDNALSWHAVTSKTYNLLGLNNSNNRSGNRNSRNDSNSKHSKTLDVARTTSSMDGRLMLT